jgi:predicted HTH transcriptional regulator
MTQSIERTSEMAAYATPELRGLFESWLEEVEKEAMNYIMEKGSVSARTLAEKLSISQESAIFIIAQLAKSGKIEASAQKGADSQG